MPIIYLAAREVHMTESLEDLIIRPGLGELRVTAFEGRPN
jgi:hypothetical protein